MALKVHKDHCGVDKPKPFKCTTCGKSFTRRATLEDHQKAHQVGGGVKRKASEQDGHLTKKVKLPNKVSGIPPADKQVSTLKGAKVDAFFHPKTETQRKDQQVFFKDTLSRLQAHLENVLSEKKAIKWNLMYHCTLSMPDPYRQVVRTHERYFRTPHPLITLYPEQLSDQLYEALETVEERMCLYAQAGSGWTLEENQALVLEMVDYHPIGGTSYIVLPKDVFDSKSIINVKNEDQACFMWSILAALHPADHNPQRVSHYEPFKDELNFLGIEFPMTIDQIPKFEKLNPEISVTVLGIEEADKKDQASKLFPLRVPDKQQEHHVVLIYWSQGENHHYAWVKNLNRLLVSTKRIRNQTFCERCFQGFTKPELLHNHSDTCRHIPIQAVQMVDEEIAFKSWAKTEECLFRVYANFECLLQESLEGEDKTVKTQKHIPCSVAWVLISDHPEVENRSFLYRPTPDEDMTIEEMSDDVLDHLMESLQELEEELYAFQKREQEDGAHRRAGNSFPSSHALLHVR